MTEPFGHTVRVKPRVRGIVVVMFAVSMAMSFNAVVGGAQEADRDRVEGVVETVKAPNAVLVRTRDRLVTVDLAALGGVTVSVTQGQKILAIGKMEPSGDILHATRLESPTSP